MRRGERDHLLRVETLPPEDNMRKDEELFLVAEESLGGPFLRVYRWDRVCLSLGYFQKEKKNLSLPVVRRPTGGGALLHGWDVSFSLVDVKERWGGTSSAIYRGVSDIIGRAFESVGIKVRLERFRGAYLDRFFCFWVPTFGELTWSGKKLVSMAMRTGKRAFLLQGSVYENFDHERASRILGVSRELLKSRITSLQEVGVPTERFLSALFESFTPVFRDV